MIPAPFLITPTIPVFMNISSFPSLELSLDALSCRRGDRILFDKLSFHAKSGDTIEIKGPNGVGKSSLIRILSGLLHAETGRLRLRDDTQEHSTLTGHLHYLGHQNSLKSAFSVIENLAFWRAFAARPGLSPEEALHEVRLTHLMHLPCGVLSAGQKRRVAFARLLVERQPVWLLDEPTAALDSSADALAGKIIGAHANAGGIVLAATHLPLKLEIAAASHRVLDLAAYPPEQSFAAED